LRGWRAVIRIKNMEFTKDLIVVCTTVDSIKEARSISRILVEENLAACIQINQVRSIFEWEDEVDESLEFKLSIKTVADNYERIEEKLLEVHPYDLPEIISVPIMYAYGPYAEWVDNQCGENEEFEDDE
jgi:periplasmic divalent cation tolerance protein